MSAHPKSVSGITLAGGKGEMSTTNNLLITSPLTSPLTSPITSSITSPRIQPTRRRSRINNTKDDFMKIQQLIIAASSTSIDHKGTNTTHSSKLNLGTSQSLHTDGSFSEESSSITGSSDARKRSYNGDREKFIEESSSSILRSYQNTTTTLEGTPSMIGKESSVGRVDPLKIKLSNAARMKSETGSESGSFNLPNIELMLALKMEHSALSDDAPPHKELEISTSQAEIARRRSSIKIPTFAVAPSIIEEPGRLGLTQNIIKLSNMSFFPERTDIFAKLSPHFVFEEHRNNKVTLQMAGKEIKNLFWIIKGCATVTSVLNFVEYTFVATNARKLKVYNDGDVLNEGEVVRIVELDTQELEEEMWFPYLPNQNFFNITAAGGSSSSKDTPFSMENLGNSMPNISLEATSADEICNYSVAAHQGSITARIDIQKFRDIVPPAFLHSMNSNASVYNFPIPFLQVEYLQGKEHEEMVAKARVLESKINHDIQSSAYRDSTG